MIIWLASYPRSGNTFLRVLLNSVFELKTYSIYGDKADIAADEKTSEIVGHQFLPEGFTIENARESEELYVIKTHDYPVSAIDKAIYIIRDGRESTLSFSKYEQDFGKQKKNLIDVIYGNVIFGGWGEHVRHWSPASRDNTLLIRFEDLIRDPVSYVERISSFIGRPPVGEAIPTFDELRKINGKFFRSGKTNSWKREYSDRDHEAFWLNNYTQMVEYGYVQDMPEMFKHPENVRLLSEMASEMGYFHTSLCSRMDIQFRNLSRRLETHPGYEPSGSKSATREALLQEWEGATRELTMQLHKQQAEVERLNESLGAGQSLIEEQNSSLQEKTRQVAELEQQLQNISSKLHEQDEALDSQRTDVEESKRQLENSRRVINEQEIKLGNQLSTITALNEQLDARQSVIEDQKSSLQSGQVMIEKFEQQLRDRQGAIKQRDRNIREKQQLVNKKNRELTRLRNQLQNKTRELSILLESKRYRIGTRIAQPYVGMRNIASSVRNIKQNVSVRGKVDLGDQLSAFYGKHRSGWSYAVSSLAGLQNENAVYLDTFIERTFDWSPEGPRAITKPWVGFIHVPPNVLDWFQPSQSNKNIFASRVWQESLPYCKGLFTLSRYHREALEKILDLPIDNLVHPTEIPALQWSWDRFIANRERKIIQLGWWLRKLHAIFMLPESGYKKVFLKVNNESYLNSLIEKEKQILIASGEFKAHMYDTAETVSYLPNRQYDEWLSENIGFVYLYDSSANNAVIECIARNVPLLVNPIPAVREYLGENYPFYYESLEEAVAKASDLDTVRKTYEYLKKIPIKKKLKGDYFRKSLVRSPIMKNLNRLKN